MIDFINTRAGKELFEKTFPEITNSLKQIARQQQTANELIKNVSNSKYEIEVSILFKKEEREKRVSRIIKGKNLNILEASVPIIIKNILNESLNDYDTYEINIDIKEEK